MATSEEQVDLAARVRAALADRPVREVSMFGGRAFLVEGRLAVSAGRGGELLVCADPAAYEQLRGRGAEPATMGPDRSMGRGWVQVPAERLADDDALTRWIEVGIEGSRSRPRRAR